MNGLRVVRTQCNFTIMDIAERLDVSKQAVSAWETGKKEIPEQRKEQLSKLFGLDKSFFGEITEEKMQELIGKAKFRKNEDGNERYTYSQDDASVDRGNVVMAYFEGIREISYTEEYLQKKDEQKILEGRIHKTFEGPSNLNLQDQTRFINRGLSLYSRFVDIINLFYSKPPTEKMVYYDRIIEVLDGILSAMGNHPETLDTSHVRCFDEQEENIERVRDLFNQMMIDGLNNAGKTLDEMDEIIKEAAKYGGMSMQWPPLEDLNDELDEMRQEMIKADKKKRSN